MHCIAFVAAVLLAAQAGQTESRVQLIAHRGGSAEADENTIGAFRQSYQRGLRRFETDFRLTRDDHVTILHDNTLDRTTTGAGPIENLTAEQVRALRCKKSGEPIPFVEDFVAFFHDKPDVFLEIEIKTSRKTYSQERLETLCRLLSEALKKGLPKGTYSFTSFDDRPLQIMKRLDPACSTTWIWNPKTADPVKKALALGCSRLYLFLDATPRSLVRQAKDAKLEVVGWFVENESDLVLAEALGVDCVVTGIPTRLKNKRESICGKDK
jgi:glycerophosphoryl diester phosphodiesterase